MTINFRGYVFNDAGAAVSGASVKLLDTGTSTQEGSTDTTDSNGLWNFDAVSEADAPFDVEITKGGSVRRIRWDDQISLKEIDVRNNTGEGTPAATFSNITSNVDDMEVVHFRALRGTGAADDNMFFRYYMNDDGGNVTEVARMTVNLVDAGAATEDAKIVWSVVSGASMVDALTISSSASAAQSIDFNQDSITFGTGTAATDITLTFDAESADGVITWMEDEDYFKFSDDILMNSTEKIQFYDTAIYIYSSTDGQLDLVADTEVQIAATTIDINGAVAFDGALTGITNITLSGTLSDGNYTFDTSGNVSGLGTVASGAITSAGTIQGTTITATTAFVPDASDGAALGTTSLEFSDLYLADEAVIGFGDDQEVTLTHVHDAGLLLSSTDKLQFGDSGTFIHQSADGVLTIESDTTVDINGAVALNGAITGATDITLSGELDAATLDISGNADIDGTTNLDAVDIDGNVQADGTITVGANDTGYDVKFFGAASGNYMLWDENTDDLVIAGSSELYFYDAAGGEHIKSDGTDMTIYAGTDLNLTAGTDINIPTGVGLTFGDDGEKIEGDGTDLTISSSGKINLTSTGDVNLSSNDLDIGANDGNPVIIDLSCDEGAEGDFLSYWRTKWDGTGVTEIISVAGEDTTNKDDGGLLFRTKPSGGSLTTRMSMGTPNTLTGTDDVEYGGVYIADTGNGGQSVGLTINQGSADNEIFTLKSSDVGHGNTDDTETDTYFMLKKQAVTDGGIAMKAYAAGTLTTVINLQAAITAAAHTDKNTGGRGVIEMRPRLVSGSGGTNIGGEGNLVVIRNNSTTKFIFDAEGDSHQDVGTAWTNFDNYDDLALVRDIRNVVTRVDDPLRQGFVDSIEASRAMLDAIPGKPIVTFNADGHHFLNTSRLAMLHHGAILQIGNRIAALETENRELKALIGR